MEEKQTETRQRLTVTVSPAGVMTPTEFKSWVVNLFIFTVPLYLGFLFTQLSVGLPLKVAAATSLVSMYGPLVDFIKKKQQETISK